LKTSKDTKQINKATLRKFSNLAKIIFSKKQSLGKLKLEMY